MSFDVKEASYSYSICSFAVLYVGNNSYIFSIHVEINEREHRMGLKCTQYRKDRIFYRCNSRVLWNKCRAAYISISIFFMRT